MQIPIHITDLTRTDFEEIARAANLEVSDGLILERNGSVAVLRLDENWLKKLIHDTIYSNQNG